MSQRSGVPWMACRYCKYSKSIDIMNAATIQNGLMRLFQMISRQEINAYAHKPSGSWLITNPCMDKMDRVAYNNEPAASGSSTFSKMSVSISFFRKAGKVKVLV